MRQLNLPPFDYNLRKADGKTEIYDVVRKKFVYATSEEWVRQHFLHYLINHLNYPKSLIRLESGLTYNRLSKRADIKVYDRNGNPFLLVECKSPDVKLTQSVFNQAACYNYTFKAAYLVATNGLMHYCCQIDHERNDFSFLNKIPSF